MSAAPARGRIRDPLATVLYDLRNLAEDMEFLLDGAGKAISKFHEDTLKFINAIEKSQTEENRNATT